MYLLKLGLRPWRLAPLSQIAATAAAGFLLFSLGLLVWLETGLKPVVVRLQREQIVTAYLDPVSPASDESRIVDSIRVAVGAGPEVKLVGPKQFVHGLGDRYPELAKELEDLGSEASTIIPRYVTAAGVMPDSALERIRSVSGVESVESTKDLNRPAAAAYRALRWATRLLALGALLAFFTGLFQLTRVNGQIQREVVAMLRLWGAGRWAQRLPSATSGFSVGLAGGALAAAAWLSGGALLAARLRDLAPSLAALSAPPSAMAIALVLAGSVAGAIAGLTSGAVTK